MSDIPVISLDLPKTPGTSISERIGLVSKFLTNDWYLNLSYVTLPTTETRNDLNIRISSQIPSLICRLNIMEDANAFDKTNEKNLAIVSSSDLLDVKREVRRKVLRIIRDGVRGME